MRVAPDRGLTHGRPATAGRRPPARRSPRRMPCDRWVDRGADHRYPSMAGHRAPASTRARTRWHRQPARLPRPRLRSCAPWQIPTPAYSACRRPGRCSASPDANASAPHPDQAAVPPAPAPYAPARISVTRQMPRVERIPPASLAPPRVRRSPARPQDRLAISSLQVGRLPHPGLASRSRHVGHGYRSHCVSYPLAIGDGQLGCHRPRDTRSVNCRFQCLERMSERVIDGGTLEAAVRHAVITGRVAADSIALPVGVLHQRAKAARVAFIGEQIAWSLPAEEIVRGRAPGRALIRLVTCEEVEEQSRMVEGPAAGDALGSGPPGAPALEDFAE